MHIFRFCKKLMQFTNQIVLFCFLLNIKAGNNNKQELLLFGPVDVREFLDASHSKTYTITVCSSKLYETRRNLFFLNFKLKQDESTTATPTNNNNNNTATNPKLSAHNLQKIQITIRKYRRVGLPNENIERSIMLNNISFFKNVLSAMSSSQDRLG